ncbi:MAG: 30S ribosomal protein S12 methylthiotransferase RimO [Candidatus Cloacimonetes bacterium]|nr:30S ribosomal protein S12 methylthiotransferase RimO [Candidatus Cloacimonadota bacterium]
MKKYSLLSLGCPKNLVDSELFAGLIEQKDFTRTEDLTEAEIIIINTCGFILDAKEESIQTILDIAELKKTGKLNKLIVTGCLVKRYYDDIKATIPEIDELVDLKDFSKFAKIFDVPEKAERQLLTPSHYGYLRISDGCNNNCSYCAIPGIRGPLNSVPMESLIIEAKRMAAKGVKELIVSAQDTAQYGVDIYGEQRLAELLEELHKIEDIKWIRVLYLHPAHVTTKIIDTFAKLPKICNYFEIPLQHINDDILTSMNRKVSQERIEEIIAEIKTKIPDAVIRTTFIVGYPYENDAAYNDLKNFLTSTKFGRVGVFTYSREEDTAAFDISEDVAEETADARKDELMMIQQKISEDFLASYVGKTIPVIIDKLGEVGEFIYEGRSYFDAPEIDGIVFIESGDAEIGDIVEVEIVDAWEYDLIGRINN